VVLVSDGSALDHSPILTVTAADSQFHAKSITYLAQDFSEKLKEALLRAYSDRQPDFLRESSNQNNTSINSYIIIQYWFNFNPKISS
jgi:hypothetical protein